MPVRTVQSRAGEQGGATILFFKKNVLRLGVVTKTFNPSASMGPYEFEASLVYIISSRPARATKQDPISKLNDN